MTTAQERLAAPERALQVAISTRHPDPHRYVASVIFDVDEHRVTPEQRKHAKEVNYLYLYGNQPKQMTLHEPWVHVESGNPYTLVLTGRDVKTLRPQAVYFDARGCCWLRPLDEFRQKFQPLEEYVRSLEATATAHDDGSADVLELHPGGDDATVGHAD